jgi:hypothetical protein
MTTATILVCLVVGWALAAVLAAVVLTQRARRRRDAADLASERAHAREIQSLHTLIGQLQDELSDVRTKAAEEVGRVQEELVDVRRQAAVEVGRLQDELSDVRQAAADRLTLDAALAREDAHVPLITAMSEPSALDGVDGVELNGARVDSVTLSGPLIKAAAFTHGVRRALAEEPRMRIHYGMRKELRRQRKMRRRRRSGRGPSEGWSR